MYQLIVSSHQSSKEVCMEIKIGKEDDLFLSDDKAKLQVTGRTSNLVQATLKVLDIKNQRSFWTRRNSYSHTVGDS